MKKEDWIKRGREDYISERSGQGYPKGNPPQEGTWQRKAWDQGWTERQQEVAGNALAAMTQKAQKRGLARKMAALSERILARHASQRHHQRSMPRAHQSY